MTTIKKKTTSTRKKKTAKKPIKKVQKKTVTKRKTTKTIKAKTDGMNEFEQCLVLAAIVNQQRNTDTRFLFTPVPDINSSVLAPLRELLSHHHFTANDICKAAHKVFQSKKFQECFALHEPVSEASLQITKIDKKDLIKEILDLAGPEGRKWIYMADKNPHDIHKTTLEKHALKMGFIEPHMVVPEPFQKLDLHKKITIRLNVQKKGQDWHHNTMRFSGKQHRGRG